MKVDTLLISLGLKYVAAKLDGYKTIIGAITKILGGGATLISGLVGVIHYAFPEQGAPSVNLDFQIGLITGGFVAIGSGIQGLGVAHKIEKLGSP